MCGIIAYVGSKDCSGFLVAGLKRLEYRGYDSAGIACYDEKAKHFNILKAEGKLENIENQFSAQDPADRISGKTGIGHTRWATHGKPNTINAHPHRAGSTVLVHNGIIENYDAIRGELLKKGVQLVSDTDSELFGHLVDDLVRQSKPLADREPPRERSLFFAEAVQTAFLRLEGSCSVVVVHDDHPGVVIAVRGGTPLVAAHSAGSGGSFVASDIQALFEHTKEVLFLEDGDIAICRASGIEIYPLRGESIKKASQTFHEPVALDWEIGNMEKEGFPHFMLKEIHEQPRAVTDTIGSLYDRDLGLPRFSAMEEMVSRASKIQLVACGTAWHAALVGKYIIETEARIPVEVDLASEYRYRSPVVGTDTLMIAISQSGETADTLAALREAKRLGAMTAAICNVRGSTLAREAGCTLFTSAGAEIGVASTKAFTAQLLVMMMLGQYIAAKKGSPSKTLTPSFFAKLPHLIQGALSLDEKIAHIAESCIESKGFLFIARGRVFPIALEGALKMKEISYIHAEGYPAGELKHGPIAMVEPSMTVVVIAPHDALYDKTVSNLQEVKARGGRIVTIGAEGDSQLERLSDHYLGCPFKGDWSDAILATIPMQLLSYHAALLKGTDVDRPRNLAKSVTVE